MKRAPRVALLCGSNRPNSFNHRLLQWMAEHLPEDIEHTLINPDDIALPLYCTNLEVDPNAIAANKHLHARLVNADAIIVASPEHNGTLSAYLKNILDWQSRISATSPTSLPALTRKWVLLASTSTGKLGGIQGLQQAKYVFSYLGCYVFPALVTVSEAGKCFESEQPVFGDAQESFIKSAVLNFSNEVRHFVNR